MTPNPRDVDPIQDEIDRNLRRVFDETATQPLPPKLTALLEQLRAKEGDK